MNAKEFIKGFLKLFKKYYKHSDTPVARYGPTFVYRPTRFYEKIKKNFKRR